MLEVEEKSLVSQYNMKLSGRGKWMVVVRYDTAHGFSHRDQYDNRGRAIKTPLLAFNFNQALTFAEADLKANWTIYREQFLKGR